MQEKNMGHICPIGRSGVKKSEIIIFSSTIYMYFNASRLQQRVPIKKNFLGEHAPKPP